MDKNQIKVMSKTGLCVKWRNQDKIRIDLRHTGVKQVQKQVKIWNMQELIQD